MWREKLAGTVWANYVLIGTQWRGNRGGVLHGRGEVPRFLANSVVETYVQAGMTGSCLGCHATAKTAAGQDADFSFLLRRAK